VETRNIEQSIFHKNLQPVIYVTAEVYGRKESPIYAILGIRERLAQAFPAGLPEWWATVPTAPERTCLKWDGEMHVTVEVFRDLGLAFAGVLILIYVLVVGWFRSFTTPLVIMAAIPFSLVGILPAHGALGAFFTATSMIGFIAGAGIVVRNSIILIDFIELRLAEGMPLAEAVIDAGAVRFPLRSHLSRPGPESDRRRGGGAPLEPHGGADPLLHAVRAALGGPRAPAIGRRTAPRRPKPRCVPRGTRGSRRGRC